MNRTRSLASHLEDITPSEMQCGIGACPAVFRRNDGKLIIVGAALPADAVEAQLHGRVGAHEAAIVVDPALLSGLLIE
ncbi:hypothetical protein SAMN05216486_10918 [bacterium JGI 053]|nr:hypothetical protein SAMN05216486_10918 [bacterium JGI 053]